MKTRIIIIRIKGNMVGLAGFEPTTPGTQNQDHTKLDHNPVIYRKSYTPI